MCSHSMGKPISFSTVRLTPPCPKLVVAHVECVALRIGHFWYDLEGAAKRARQVILFCASGRWVNLDDKVGEVRTDGT